MRPCLFLCLFFLNPYCMANEILNFARDWVQREDSRSIVDNEHPKERVLHKAPNKKIILSPATKAPISSPREIVTKPSLELSSSITANSTVDQTTSSAIDTFKVIPGYVSSHFILKKIFRAVSLISTENEFRSKNIALREDIKVLTDTLDSERIQQQSMLNEYSKKNEEHLELNSLLDASVKRLEEEKKSLIEIVSTLEGVLDSYDEAHSKLIYEAERETLHGEMVMQEKIISLQQQLETLQNPPLPTSELELQDFSAGISIGIDILDILKERDALGVIVNRQIFLDGLSDAILENNRLPEYEFKKYLAQASLRVQDASMERIKKREIADHDWLQTFSSQKDVETAGSGVWYRIIHSGDQDIDEIPSSSEIVLAVNRKLTSGKVVSDSDITGLVLQERFVNYPKWLQTAIKDAKIHGEVELAVKVDNEGTPWEDGKLIEHWLIRVSDVLIMD